MAIDPKPSQAKQTPGLPPMTNDNPVDVPTLGNAPDGMPTIKTVGAPLMPSGEVTVVPPPVVLANSIEADPSNPAHAPRIGASQRNAERRKFQEELTDLQRRKPADLSDADHDRIHELHYLVNGQEVPAA